ncbi:hypothetical protein [Mycolicibacterium holsaticum]|uniref:hypothetical protein n=1 Tax=Mycolicibacterium holsaticum TaxID=152142 RepID=UPI001C7DB63C|nr:hypothetical protein [Mycolicibacterium holsaticum]MDA4109717.1 hypothetical protein [Mycolicibacterium holsaticum DSM 44478 = JCM 12374]QZA10643.1 hypothetical protein K3U96_15255 [Mycolicibacterium holsaticum DSM 44478 = JCM 12374]UNC11852.1 hypothetical protein H5U41_11575 [Mycolicibacterium holsaticum DSM 44478 = JCM 12374]
MTDKRADAMEDLLSRAGLMFGVADKAVRIWRLGEWALLHRVRQDDGSSHGPDPVRFVPDKGSSLALDDAGFELEIAATMLPLADADQRQNLVSTNARFPAMVAAENLVGAVQVHGAALKERRTSNVSIGTLCRSAIENAAKTVWLLCEPDRAVRRARCLGYTARERSYQKSYIEIEEQIYAQRGDNSSPQYRLFEETKQKYETRHQLIEALPEDRVIKPPRKFEKIVEVAAKWIDDNPPPHVTAANGLQYGMTLGAQRFYAFGSSFVHGYKWMSDYVGSERDILAQISDGLAAAVTMTECAVALYEAQSTHPARTVVRQKNYPHWLEPTLEAWRPRYQQDTSTFAEPMGCEGTASG